MIHQMIPLFSHSTNSPPCTTLCTLYATMSFCPHPSFRLYSQLTLQSAASFRPSPILYSK